MDLERYNAFCKSLPCATHVVQWGGSHVWKVGGKLFAIFSYPAIGGTGITFKCSPLSFQLLLEQPGCRSAPYLHEPWIQCTSQESLDDTGLEIYLKESHRLIFAALSKKLQTKLRAGC